MVWIFKLRLVSQLFIFFCGLIFFPKLSYSQELIDSIRFKVLKEKEDWSFKNNNQEIIFKKETKDSSGYFIGENIKSLATGAWLHYLNDTLVNISYYKKGNLITSIFIGNHGTYQNNQGNLRLREFPGIYKIYYNNYLTLSEVSNGPFYSKLSKHYSVFDTTYQNLRFSMNWYSKKNKLWKKKVGIEKEKLLKHLYFYSTLESSIFEKGPSEYLFFKVTLKNGTIYKYFSNGRIKIKNEILPFYNSVDFEDPLRIGDTIKNYPRVPSKFALTNPDELATKWGIDGNLKIKMELVKKRDTVFMYTEYYKDGSLKYLDYLVPDPSPYFQLKSTNQWYFWDDSGKMYNFNSE